jgi:hypothetical protein
MGRVRAHRSYWARTAWQVRARRRIAVQLVDVGELEIVRAPAGPERQAADLAEAVGREPEGAYEAGRRALTIAPCMPSATACVNVTSTSAKPASASIDSYSPHEWAPAMQPT